MSFHPLMVYDPAKFQQSERAARSTKGRPFALTPERRAQLDEILTKYPPDRKRSAVLAALYLVQEQQGYLTGNAHAPHRAAARPDARPKSRTSRPTT